LRKVNRSPVVRSATAWPTSPAVFWKVMFSATKSLPSTSVL